MNFFQELQNVITGDVVIDQNEKYARDWSLFSIMPSAVIFPRNSQDIQMIVHKVSEEKKHNPSLSITARAAGTDMTGGPLNDSLILDTTKYMSGVLEIHRHTPYTQQSFFGHHYDVTGNVRVLPGTYYRDFEKITQAQGLLLPCYPASKDLCAVGGMVANNGAGERTLKYGQNKDFVKKLRVVLADGNEYDIGTYTWSELQQLRAQNTWLAKAIDDTYTLIKSNWSTIERMRPKTSKNASGYYVWDILDAESPELFEQGQGVFDATKLFVGAQGTTGIITEITYGLVDVQPVHDLVVVYVYDMKRVPELVQTCMRHDIEMLEMYDDHTFKIGLRFLTDFLKKKGIWGGLWYTLRFLPEVIMAMRYGIPELIVLASIAGTDEATVTHASQSLADELGLSKYRCRLVTRDQEEEKFWDFRHDSFKILTEHSAYAQGHHSGKRTAPFIDDIAVNPEYLAEYLPRLMEILDSYQLTYTIAGHLGNGNFHIIPLMDIATEIKPEVILEISRKVYTLALSYHGTLSAEHNDGIIRTPFLRQQFGDEMITLFEQVKNIWDPQNIFNPKKKVGGTFQDVTKALRG